MQLKNKKLFRQKCYVDGEWLDADSGETVEVSNPADGVGPRDDSEDGGGRDPPRHRGGQCGVAGLAGPDRQGTLASSCAAGTT